jgi:hypothetical protein
MAALEYNDRQSREQLAAALEELWRKISIVTGVIQQLKESNKALFERNNELEETVHSLEDELRIRDKKIQDIEEKRSLNVDVGDRLLYLTPDEREAMEQQIDELLALLKPHVG